MRSSDAGGGLARRRLCLRVRSIGEAAKLTVLEATNTGKPRFVKYRGADGENSGVGPVLEAAE
jgi:hypothetical protein